MKKYIVITGGQLYNKGAQAMTFITVDEMAKQVFLIYHSMENLSVCRKIKETCFQNNDFVTLVERKVSYLSGFTRRTSGSM